ncbi:imidazolonepropionase-like domain-containing protein [Kitasatospora sp. NPDC051705]|uniref:imidazolonepropionase-like domain-containing protein n=1 Tax=Kitasatospora sp. NPDC051705 TaxID=3364057 RepID=UPI0037A1FC06
MLTLHRAALVLPDPADPTAPSLADGAVLVRGERVEAVGAYAELAAAHPGARVRDWGAAVLTPGLRNPYGHRLLERDYHPDPREGIGVEPLVDGLVDAGDAGAAGATAGPGAAGASGASGDDARCGASARRGLQRMLGFGVTAVAGPFERSPVRTAVARSGLVALPGDPATGADADRGAAPGAAGGRLLDPLAVLPLSRAVHGRVTVGGRADFAVFPAGRGAVGDGLGDGRVGGAVDATGDEAGAGEAAVGVGPLPGGCLATVLAGRLVYRRR